VAEVDDLLLNNVRIGNDDINIVVGARGEFQIEDSILIKNLLAFIWKIIPYVLR